MKILLLTEFFPADDKLIFNGGVEARTYYIAKYLAQNNRVYVICRKTKRLNKKIIKNNLTVYPCGLSTAKPEASFSSIFSRFIFMFSAVMRGFKIEFDLVEGSNFTSYLPVYLLGLIKKKPKVIWVADLFLDKWFKYFQFTGIFGYILEKFTLALNWDGVIALSENTKMKLLKHQIKSNKITIIYGGIDKDEFKTQNQQLKKGIIAISRLVKYKRIEDLIEAFSLLVKLEKFPYNLTIIGNGPEENKLKNQANRLGLNNKIIFLSHLARKELIKQLSNNAVFCLPSLVEGFGLVTIEAAACKTPFVISDTQINREISSSLGGLFFKPMDPRDLKNQILKLIKDKVLYRKKQRETVTLVKKYDWQIQSNRTSDFYRKVWQDTI